MEELYNFLINEDYINEAVYCVTTNTADEAFKFIMDNFSKSSRINTNILKDFLNTLYDIWKKDFNNIAEATPFRFADDKKTAKIARIYSTKNNILRKIPGVTIASNGSNIKIDNKITFVFGDGSLHGSRAKKGLDYELILIDNICNMCAQIAQISPKKKLNETEFKKIFADYDNLYNMYNLGGFDNVIELSASNPQLNLYEYILSTGKQDTKRNKDKQIFDEKFNITSNENEINDILEQSGQIISDITIKTPNNPDVYISVKLDKAQLSGLVYNSAFYMGSKGNTKSYDGPCTIYYINNHTKWNDIPKKDIEGFINFFNTFGMDPEEVYNQYLNNDFKPISIHNFNNEKLSNLLQLLMGGNYWYITPKISIPVTNKHVLLDINIIDANISESGKTININGTIKNNKINFVFRSDNKTYEYPYRLFPKLKVKDIVDSIK